MMRETLHIFLHKALGLLGRHLCSELVGVWNQRSEPTYGQRSRSQKGLLHRLVEPIKPVSLLLSSFVDGQSSPPSLDSSAFSSPSMISADRSSSLWDRAIHSSFQHPGRKDGFATIWRFSAVSTIMFMGPKSSQVSLKGLRS